MIISFIPKNSSKVYFEKLKEKVKEMTNCHDNEITEMHLQITKTPVVCEILVIKNHLDSLTSKVYGKT